MTGPERRNRLYDLLPAIHRMRDELAGGTLRELLAVIGEQVDVVERDIDRLYDNWFIETCDDWVVPYLGDLIGYRPIAEAGSADPVTGARAARVLVPRRDVATTIAHRRRKGTLALLEELAGTAAGLPARAVEYAPLLGRTQHLDHPRPGAGAYVDLRSGERLDRLGGAFDDVAHRPDVRRPDSHRSPGRYGVANVGLHVWRRASYPVTRARPACRETRGDHCFTFSVLGDDTELHARRRPGADRSHLAGEGELPAPIRRRAFERRISEHPLVATASPDHYGPDRNLCIEAVDWPSPGTSGPIPAGRVVPADLSDWDAVDAEPGTVLVDPERGRFLFPRDQPPGRDSLYVSYRYGFGADIGAGEYRRARSQPRDHLTYRVRARGASTGEFDSPAAAYLQWRADRAADGGEATRAAVIEVMDSDDHGNLPAVSLGPGEYLQLRAAPMSRPTLRLVDRATDVPDSFRVEGRAGARFVLDGFLVTGQAMVVSASVDDGGRPDGLCDVVVRHCTLVPGWAPNRRCEPDEAAPPSLRVKDPRARIAVEHSIVGAIHVVADERLADPVRLSVTDSIVDAGVPTAVRGRERRRTSGAAVCDDAGHTAFATLTLARSTVFGRVLVHAVELAENSIVTDTVEVARRQVGCVRHSYVPPGSRTPRRYRCEPDTAAQRAADDVAERAPETGAPVHPEEVARARRRAADRVRPVFASRRYGRPAYGSLGEQCAPEIVRGADDGSELGAFHDLYLPQRTANLRQRLDEHIPAGTDAGIVHEN